MLRHITRAFGAKVVSLRTGCAPSIFPNRVASGFYRSFASANNSGNVVVSFKHVDFEYTHGKPILKDASFTVRGGSKTTIMGQNGSGKSTILSLINGRLKAQGGTVNVLPSLAVATAMQVIPRDCLDLTIKDFFIKQLHGNSSGAESRIVSVLQRVKLEAPMDRIVRSFSGGQQARLLLASALILEPDILILDEPTNNLDVAGLDLLSEVIHGTLNTVLVISHDEAFLNSFTDSVLYLDNHKKAVEQYDGNYNLVKSEITARIQRENAENARLQKEAKAKKEQAGSFANKGGGLRKVAKKMREEAEKFESQKVIVRKEDKTLKSFEIPLQKDGVKGRTMMKINYLQLPGDSTKYHLKAGSLELERGSHVHIFGPNGIGKTTLLESIVNRTAEGVKVNPTALIGYYRQDFHNLDFEKTALWCLENASNGKHSEQEVRMVAASLLLRGDVVKQQIKTMSEGQKGLVSLACLVLAEPAILVVDEPTNHLNFRHLPAVAKALNDFKGLLLLVSHDTDFVKQIRIDDHLDIAFEAHR